MLDVDHGDRIARLSGARRSSTRPPTSVVRRSNLMRAFTRWQRGDHLPFAVFKIVAVLSFMLLTINVPAGPRMGPHIQRRQSCTDSRGSNHRTATAEIVITLPAGWTRAAATSARRNVRSVISGDAPIRNGMPQYPVPGLM